MIIDILVWTAYGLTLFVAVYWVLLLMERGKRHHEPLPAKTPRSWPGLTVIVPAYNEEESLERTVKSLLALDYPRKKLTIAIMDDGSADRTPDIGRRLANAHASVTYTRQENQGKAVALNNALQNTDTPFFACLDADSFVESGAAKAMVSRFLADEELEILTPVMRVAEPKTWLQRFQRIEYLAAMLLVRMMASMEGNYVAPGPFSMYRTETIRNLGGFDEDNLVEDQEIAYRVQANHGKIRQVEQARVDTIAPRTFRALSKQRNRWMKGTLLNILQYRRLLFNKRYGEFGVVVMPITLITFLLAVIAVLSFAWYTVRPLWNLLRELWLVGFDIAPYLNNIRISYNLLDPNYTNLLLIWMLLAISVFLLFTAARFYRDDLTRYGRFYILPYFFIYFLLLSFISVRVVIEVLIGKKQKW